MSVTIRLSRFGKKFAPSYKIVVSNTRNKRDGKFLDILGYYNPSENPVKYDIDKDKYEKWVGNGAMVSDAVKKIVDGTYEYIPYTGATKNKQEKTAKDDQEEAPKSEDKDSGTPEEKPEDKVETKPEDTQEESKNESEKTEETNKEQSESEKETQEDTKETEKNEEK
jgi:small subunit ribosomal protein S16